MKKNKFIIMAVISSLFLVQTNANAWYTHPISTINMDKNNTQYTKAFNAISVITNATITAEFPINGTGLDRKPRGSEDVMKAWCTAGTVPLDISRKVGASGPYPDSYIPIIQTVYGGVNNTKVVFETLAWCVANGYVEHVDFYDSPHILGGEQVDFCDVGTAAATRVCNYDVYLNSDATYKGVLSDSVNGDRITMRGERTLLTPSRKKTLTLNTPSLYFTNPPKGSISATIDSDLQTYSSQKPGFNIMNGWKVDSDGKSIFVNSTKQNHLFYELAVKKVNLSRNGKNFSSKEELIHFLKNSDFYTKLGLTEKQKQDSLGYFLPKIESSPNYYLTILDDSSIENISKLNISPKPETLIRKYFSVYPTTSPVKTLGDLQYPEITTDKGFTIQENGEIYVSPDMVVLWK